MIKDILGLLLYIPVLYLSIIAPMHFCLFLFLNLDYIDPLYKPIIHILCNIVGENTVVAEIIVATFFSLFLVAIAFSMVWLPMFVTNYALDKKWSRILNIFFENIQYSTLLLIILIFLQVKFNLELWLYIIAYIFIYLSTIARKFVKKSP